MNRRLKSAKLTKAHHNKLKWLAKNKGCKNDRENIMNMNCRAIDLYERGQKRIERKLEKYEKRTDEIPDIYCSENDYIEIFLKELFEKLPNIILLIGDEDFLQESRTLIIHHIRKILYRQRIRRLKTENTKLRNFNKNNNNLRLVS